jgi:S1-C subfamily serine protease
MDAHFKTAEEREAGVACPFCTGRLAAGEPVALCAACGTAHHRRCWEENGETCGAYACAPARRETAGLEDSTWKITTDELERAAPLPPRRIAVVPAASAPTLQRSPRGINRMAIAALIVAIAGIPLFGVLTGAVAVILGALALGAIHQTQQRGMPLAIGGLILGIADVVGWVLFLTFLLNQPQQNVDLTDLKLDMSTLQGLDPQINQAMRANVFIQTEHGLGGTSVGSGVILRLESGKALIVTNRHVVDPNYAPERPDTHTDLATLPVPQVRFIGQDAPQGKVIWLAPNGVDLALISAPYQSNDALAARWQKARGAHVGDPVFAIGNPHALGWSYSQGTVSQFRAMTVGGEELRIVQTNAAINPGNSGGGLYDKEGYLLGINTLTADKKVAEGLSFAIGIDVLLKHAPLGVEGQTP